MIYYQVEARLYNYSFKQVAQKVKDLAIQKSVTVQFICTGVLCFVDKNTDLELLFHDYNTQCKLLHCYKELEILKAQMYGELYRDLQQPPKLTTYRPH